MIGDWKEGTIYRAPTRRQDSLRAAIGWVCSRTEKRRQAAALQKSRLPAESETADGSAGVFWRAPSGARTRYRAPTPAHRPAALREAFFDFYVDAEGAVVVAEGDDGDVAVDVVFHLNDLLLGGADVADVGDSEVVGDLLFDGDAGGGVLFGAAGGDFCKAGIDAEAGDAEEAFEAATELAGNGFREQRPSTGTGTERIGAGATAAR